MIKFSIFISAFILLMFARTSLADFTVSAEDERMVFIYLDSKIVKSYFENLDIYSKFFPDIDSIKIKDSTESLWSYRVEIVLQKSYMVIFDQIRQTTDDSLIIFESKAQSRDYLYWKASFIPASENQTTVKVKIKVSMTRDKASDIHFLAPIFGEKYICSEMKSKLAEGLKTFLNKSTYDLYAKSKNITNQK